MWRRLHQVLLGRLGKAERIDWERASSDSASGQAKGERSYRQESDGSWQTGLEAPLVADGVPLAIALTAANVHDSKMFEKLKAIEGATEEAARRQGLRRQEVPPSPEGAQDQEPHN